jgi:alpha-L-fucosidase 2
MNRAGLALALAWSVPVLAADAPLPLWYRQPARLWTEALPIGNGRLGAMVFGGTAEERLQLNEDTVWTGAPHEYQHEGAVKALPELRRLLSEGRQKEAEELAMREFMSVPLRQKAYQPMADLLLRFPGHETATDYRRELDLDSAIASLSYRVGGASYGRETFSSHPDQVLVQRLSASRKGSLTFSAALTSPHEGFAVRVGAPNELVLSARVKDGAIRFETRLRVIADGGRMAPLDGGIAVEGADAVTLLLTAATNFVSFRDVSGDPSARAAEAMRRAAAAGYARLRASHLADHQRLFRRVSLDLGSSPAALLPTDERIAAADKRLDPQLVALAFQFGRYLLIASSRPGDQPANLQGIWNDSLTPPWDSKYTVNINTEMNYWPAEVANLAECAEPLFAMLEDLVISGRRTAAAHYGARGWVLHHNTDLWRGSAPINASNHGIWPTGGAWLTQQLWWRYQFSLDQEFLGRRAYPVMKEAALFFVDALVRDPKTGWLVSGPSNSPENGGLVMGPTMDHQIIRALFQWTAEAARILGVDSELAAQLDRMRAEVAPNRIGRLGQLQEWLEDKDDPENKHRHVSHLWGVFPGEEITPRTPELFAAARKSLEFRGDDGTGWSLGWKIAFWARFFDGDHAERMIERQLQPVREQGTRMSGGGTYPNLLDAHPPFQIDGNFALTAGVCEMLLQSHGGELVLLPALPRAWPNGSVRGLRARGGFLVDLRWRDGKLVEAGIVSTSETRVRLRSRDHSGELKLTPGRRAHWRPRAE